jgi:hypothetical protein
VHYILHSSKLNVQILGNFEAGSLVVVGRGILVVARMWQVQKEIVPVSATKLKCKVHVYDKLELPDGVQLKPFQE